VHNNPEKQFYIVLCSLVSISLFSWRRLKIDLSQNFGLVYLSKGPLKPDPNKYTPAKLNKFHGIGRNP
jgi:hypothetical protein